MPHVNSQETRDVLITSVLICGGSFSLLWRLRRLLRFDSMFLNLNSLFQKWGKPNELVYMLFVHNNNNN